MKLFPICPFLSRVLITQMTESCILSPYFTDTWKPLSASLRSSSKSKGIGILNLSCYNCKKGLSKNREGFHSLITIMSFHVT